MFVIGLTMISPASLNNSAQATAQTSARVLTSMDLRSERAHGRLVLGFAAR